MTERAMISWEVIDATDVLVTVRYTLATEGHEPMIENSAFRPGNWKSLQDAVEANAPIYRFRQRKVAELPQEEKPVSCIAIGTSGTVAAIDKNSDDLDDLFRLAATK